jgi:hypothetical protein
MVMRNTIRGALIALMTTFAGVIAAEEGASPEPSPSGEVSSPAAPRPAPVEPVVAPVKRSAPQMPASLAQQQKSSEKIKKLSGKGTASTASKDGRRDHDCGTGEKPAKSGGACVNIAGDTNAGKRPDKTAKKK